MTLALTPVSVVEPSFSTVTENCTVSPASQRPLPPPPPVEQVSATVACPLTLACGPQATAGYCSVRVQLSIVPTSTLAWSTTRRVQVPAALIPSAAESRQSGRKLPVKGAVPAAMAVAASSSKTVLV